ncbi:aminotransferase class I/II-fold pyridoxal phosphate-dependent enzyme [Actinoplanes sp. NPDC049548]|uniref:pyridoxal phosphate-dependent aminotransferase n=1 Tax=Actinoplanes sp. NPDC049548 TaxID=3155152 RepID=UPI003441B9D9
MTGAVAGRALRDPFAVRAQHLNGSSLAELFVLARERSAIDLAVGTPGFPVTPPRLIEGAVEALRSGRNQYEAAHGEAMLRRQIADSFSTPADPDTDITVTVGGTEALCAAVLASVDPGDEVVILEPFYENFVNAIALAGGVPRVVSLRAPHWRLDAAELAEAFGPRTRALIVNSPSNPTGRMLTLEELDEIARLCERWDVTVISDEVYAGLVFDGRNHLSVMDVPGLRDRSIVIGSLSKSLAVSGWRLGYLRAEARRTDVLRRVHEVTSNGAAAPLQFAAGHAGLVAGERWRPAIDLAARRDVAQQIFGDLGFTFQPAEGGCFLLADISAVTAADCRDYVRRLLEESAVLVVPATPFFADPERGSRYVRIAFNRTLDTLRAAERNLSR